MEQCIECPAGYFCQKRTVNPIECGSIALFCPLSSATVQPATQGYYTTGGESETTRQGETECEVGFACSGGAKSSCDGSGQVRA